MSTFSVQIKRIRAIEKHTNADSIEFAVIDGYRSIVKKGAFQPGQLVAYIPENSLLPETLLKELGFWDVERQCGKLHGKDGNRLSAIKLRGELSQGICYAVNEELKNKFFRAYSCELKEGDEVSQLMGITKYEPPIPVAMAGQVFSVGQELTLAFDVENWKSQPNILREGEDVIFTEKLHGTCTVIAILPYKHCHPDAFGKKKNILIFSKGLGAKGLVFKNSLSNEENLYVRSTRDLVARIDELQTNDENGVEFPNFILGETFGPGVQDLAYGNEVGFRVFAAACGYRQNLRYHDWSFLEDSLKSKLDFELVPFLYRGPFSETVMRDFTDGKTTMNADHIREGIVMVPARERIDHAIGRVCLKSVSANYLTRKDGTEYT